MHVDIFDWDDEDFDRGNTRHIISAGYEPEDIEEAIRGYQGRIGVSRESGRPMIDVDIDGEPTRIIFEIDPDDRYIISPQLPHSLLRTEHGDRKTTDDLRRSHARSEG